MYWSAHVNQLTEEKFVRIVEENSNLLLKIAYSYTKNEFDSQDVVQETFIKLYRTRKEFKSDEHIKNWLIRVVINACLDILKHSEKKLLIDNEYINLFSLFSLFIVLILLFFIFFNSISFFGSLFL